MALTLLLSCLFLLVFKVQTILLNMQSVYYLIWVLSSWYLGPILIRLTMIGYAISIKRNRRTYKLSLMACQIIYLILKKHRKSGKYLQESILMGTHLIIF